MKTPIEPMTIVTRSLPTDAHVILSFSPHDPISATQVQVSEGDGLPYSRYVELIDQAALRLAAYAADYRAAQEEEQ